jgi:hypothetical protein
MYVDKRLNVQWHKLHNQEPPDLCTSSRTVRVVKSGYDRLNIIISHTSPFLEAFCHYLYQFTSTL